MYSSRVTGRRGVRADTTTSAPRTSHVASGSERRIVIKMRSIDTDSTCQSSLLMCLEVDSKYFGIPQDPTKFFFVFFDPGESRLEW